MDFVSLGLSGWGRQSQRVATGWTLGPVRRLSLSLSFLIRVPVPARLLARSRHPGKRMRMTSPSLPICALLLPPGPAPLLGGAVVGDAPETPEGAREPPAPSLPSTVAPTLPARFGALSTSKRLVSPYCVPDKD